MPPPNSPNSRHPNDIYTSRPSHTRLPQGNPQRQIQHIATSGQAHRRSDPSFLGVGSQFNNIESASYGRESPQTHRAICPVYTIIPQNSSTRSLPSSSARHTHINGRPSAASIYTVTARLDYVHTRQVMESDLRSISAPDAIRNQPQHTAAGRTLFQVVRRPRIERVDGGQQPSAQAPQASTLASHHGSSLPHYSQMARWRGETANQQPWHGVGAVAAVSEPRCRAGHDDQPRVYDSNRSLR